MGRLSFEYPFITTIPEQSNIMGIVGRKDKNWVWFLNHFIQLQINRNTNYYLGLNFSYGDNYKLVKDNPLLETYGVPRDIIAIYSTMSSFIKNALDAGYFVYCSVDVFEIEGYKQYHLKHGNHDLMIIGYDLDGVDIVDFFELDYCLKKCSFDQLEQGCNGFSVKRDNAGFPEIILLKVKKDYAYTFQIGIVKMLVKEYLEGINSNIHFLPVKEASMLDMDSYAFGLNIYPVLKDYLLSIQEGEIQLRSLHILYEHKRMLAELLNYLCDEQCLRNSDINMDRMSLIVQNVKILCNLAIKYNMGGQRNCISSMLLHIDSIMEQEKALFETLLTDIMDEPLNQLCENTKSGSHSRNIVYSGMWEPQSNQSFKSCHIGDTAYYLFRGNQVVFHVIPQNEDRYIRLNCDGDEKKYCIPAEEESVIISELMNGYHYVFLKNTEPCMLELLSIECNTADTHNEKNFCIFDGTDTLTKGDWKSKYGSNGYDIVSYEKNFPFYMRVVYSDFTDKVWKLSEKTDYGQALVVGSGEKIAACKSFEKEAMIDMIIAGKKTQKISLYFMDCYTFDREISITIVDADSLEVLDIQKVHVKNEGIYVSYKVKGHLLIKLQNCEKALGVISAIFVDEDCSCS